MSIGIGGGRRGIGILGGFGLAWALGLVLGGRGAGGGL